MSLNNLINSNDVLILSKNKCKFCVIAKNALSDLNVRFKDIDIETDVGKKIFSEAKEMTGQNTVPNIWYKGHHIGGSDKLLEKIREGIIISVVKPFILDEDF